MILIFFLFPLNFFLACKMTMKMLIKALDYDLFVQQLFQIFPKTCATICGEYAFTSFVEYDEKNKIFKTPTMILGKNRYGLWCVFITMDGEINLYSRESKDEPIEFRNLKNLTTDIWRTAFLNVCLPISFFTQNIVAEDEFVLCTDLSTTLEIFQLLRKKFPVTPRHILRGIAKKYLLYRSELKQSVNVRLQEDLTCVIKNISLSPLTGEIVIVFYILGLDRRKHILQQVVKYIENVYQEKTISKENEN